MWWCPIVPARSHCQGRDRQPFEKIPSLGGLVQSLARPGLASELSLGLQTPALLHWATSRSRGLCAQRGPRLGRPSGALSHPEGIALPALTGSTGPGQSDLPPPPTSSFLIPLGSLWFSLSLLCDCGSFPGLLGCLLYGKAVGPEGFCGASSSMCPPGLPQPVPPCGDAGPKAL